MSELSIGCMILQYLRDFGFKALRPKQNGHHVADGILKEQYCEKRFNITASSYTMKNMLKTIKMNKKYGECNVNLK